MQDHLIVPSALGTHKPMHPQFHAPSALHILQVYIPTHQNWLYILDQIINLVYDDREWTKSENSAFLNSLTSQINGYYMYL